MGGHKAEKLKDRVIEAELSGKYSHYNTLFLLFVHYR